MNTTPVLLLNFNRPHLTRQLVNQLRLIKPLFIMASIDGPRSENEKDNNLCNQVFDELSKIDWKCEIEFIRHLENQGLRKAVKTAIDHFFIKYEKGIILEDDIVFGKDFWEYASFMLAKSELKDSNIAAISGNNFVSHQFDLNLESGVLTKIFHCWGWATWREKWALYSDHVEVDESFTNDQLQQYLGDKKAFQFWSGIRQALALNSIQSWAWRFQFSAWKADQYFLTPPVNLAFNNGFDDDATQTKGHPDSLKGISVNTLHNDTLILNNFHPEKRPIIDAIENLTILGLLSTTSLDIGCGLTPKNLFNAEVVFGIDIRDGVDLNVVARDLVVETIPFPDNFFDALTAHDFVEHVPRIIYNPNRRFPFIELMNEIYRVLKPGGNFLSFTPAYPHAEAFRDPTHVNIITDQTFPVYFDNVNIWGKMYGFKGKFRIVSQEWRGPHLLSILQKEV